MFFDELSNDEWAQISALVSDEPAVRLNRRGRPRAEPRIVANAVLWILTTGEPWSKLPGRYPSGPTCRRRFEEWQANGTLAEVIRLLTQNGRAFAYIPEPTPPAAPKPAPVIEAPKPRDDLARGVFWKSPETWQASSPESGVPNGAPTGWRALAPMADITRQLAGSSAVETGFADAGAVDAPQPDTVSALDAVVVFDEAPSVDMHVVQVQSPVQVDADQASVQLDADAESTSLASAHTPLWMSLAAPPGLQVADRQGYTIYVAAEPVPNDKYRAWAEIMKDGKRVERSGLIGPRFADVDAAHRFALDWARQWIDRECRTQDAAVGLHAAAPKPAVRAVTRAMPELTPTPVNVAVGAVAGAGAGGNPHLPQQINPRLMPLRKYPAEAAVKDKAGERYLLPVSLLSHVG